MSVIKPLVATTIGVLAIGMSGLGVNLAFGHDVTLVVDGHSSDLTVTYASVAEVLNDQNIVLTDHDRVWPSLDTIVSSDMTVEVNYGRPIDLTVNGQEGTYWTYATNVAGVVSGLGLSETSIQVSADQLTAIDRDGMALSIDTGYDVQVAADGQANTIHAFGTVGDALTAAGLTWDEDDQISPSLDTPLADQQTITLVRVSQQSIERTSAIAFNTENSDDPEATKGRVTVVVKGANGELTQTILQTLHDGVVVEEAVTAEVVSVEPVTQVTKTGTKAPEISTPTVTAPATVTPSGDAQAIAHQMLADRGWGEDQFSCLVSLWNRESGWRTNAANPSGAYGIPQALPGSKMAAFGADWKTNPATQIAWGLSYISGRYGTPCGAWGAFQSKGWY
ncbi:MAG: ubiquitin-like domain-containing protein [Propionibacteriaceae bacterium]|nr:ubiquitin-like domain-containing protein [Propionibacteriaceae bacterium]